ncbi:hypothetical protein ACFQ3T_22270, partial [Saccharothrix hoggarensis]
APGPARAPAFESAPAQAAEAAPTSPPESSPLTSALSPEPSPDQPLASPSGRPYFPPPAAPPSPWSQEQPVASPTAWPQDQFAQPSGWAQEQHTAAQTGWSQEQHPVPPSGWPHQDGPTAPTSWAPPPPVPRTPPPPRDPLAVALANASLLSAGYVMLGRKWIAAATGLVTLALLVVLTSTARSVWMEIGVLAWWVAMIAHGWYLARARRQDVTGAKKQRLIAVAVTVPVLLAFGLLRWDAARIESDTTAAREAGDCARALSALDRLWAGHELANAPLAARGDNTVEACDRLRQAGERLDTALGGDTAALEAGFTGLSSVLADLPGHEKMVDTSLNGFLDRLPISTACDTREITDWLRDREASGNGLDRAADVVPRLAPAAIVQCADDHMEDDAWEQARAGYQQLLDEYPGHELAARAEEGVRKATLAIELANVRRLLTAPHGTVQPPYCKTAAPYSGAPAYRAQSPNRAMVFGNPTYSGKLPAEWLAPDAAEAVLVICAGETEFGAPVQTCPYEADVAIGGRKDVTFHKIAIPVRVFELRTGQLVADTRVEIGGASCPAILSYTSHASLDLGPPSQVYVTASDADVHAGFNGLINP